MPYIITALLVLLFSQPVSSANLSLPLDDLEGEKHSLTDFIGKGKWAVVNVWAIDCPYCRHELAALTNFHEQHHDKDAIVIGLTLHWPSFGFPDNENLYFFALENFIDYPLLKVDAELASHVIGEPVNMIPLTFLYNPEGRLVIRINGVVTYTMLEQIINDPPEHYEVRQGVDIPPVFRKE